MIAKELISNQLAPLDLSDTAEQAITMMHIYKLKHLPLVNDEDVVLGIISEDDLLLHGLDRELEGIKVESGNKYVSETDHLFDVLAAVAENELTSIAVVNEENKFVGIISQQDLLQFYASNFSYEKSGSILVVEMKDSAYSLAELARLIEGEQGVILSSSLTKVENTENSLVTLKLNKSEISSIVATLERFGFEVMANFSEKDYGDNLKDRYDALMNYLNV